MMAPILVLAAALAPSPLAAHADHPEGPASFGDYLHYVFSFDHYAGTIAVLVGAIGFVLYRTLRRKVVGRKEEE